jgi:flap endonuclease-1
VYACCSKDSDCLVFGSVNTILGLKASSKECVFINLPEVLSGLGLDYDSFVDFCILCGTDYNENIKGWGPARALTMIKQFKSIEAMIDAKSITGEEAEKLKYTDIRESFKNPLVSEDCEINFNQSFNKDALVDFLVEEKKFSKGRLEKSLIAINDFFEKNKK